MKFEPLHYGDKLTVLNPRGTVAIITLWSTQRAVIRELKIAGADLSNVAVIGNLYGEGFRFLIRNLLYNPQIDTVLILGRDTTQSSVLIQNFLSCISGRELIPVNYDLPYFTRDGEKVGAARIVGTEHILDDMVKPEMFNKNPVSIFIAGLYLDDEGVSRAVSFLSTYKPKYRTGKRINIEVPKLKLDHAPSDPRGHMIIENTPATAWKNLVHRLYRFGREVEFEKGKRRELQNVKVVVNDPGWEGDNIIAACGYKPSDLREHQNDMLFPLLPIDKTYTYGSRLRNYFKRDKWFNMDTLYAVCMKLEQGFDDRAGYCTTWDNVVDIEGEHRPCLVSLFFRKEKGRIHLTATFRSHNASNGWYQNFYGLMAYQNYVCDKIGVPPGAITVFSHSITLDPTYIEKAKIIHDEVAKERRERRDPNGHFTFKIDNGEIVASHWRGGDVIKEYRAHRPELIQQWIYRDCAVSDINHAFYVGRQLEKVFRAMNDGEIYVES